jgi:hypothetical protein
MWVFVIYFLFRMDVTTEGRAMPWNPLLGFSMYDSYLTILCVDQLTHRLKSAVTKRKGRGFSKNGILDLALSIVPCHGRLLCFFRILSRV